MNWIQKLIWGPDYAAMGEPGFKFDPHWPGPLIGEAGAMANYVMAIAAIGLLALLFRRSAHPRLERARHWSAAACAGLAAVLVPIFAGPSWWSIGLLIIMVALLIGLLVSRRWAGILTLGRVALVAFLLRVVSGTLAWNLALAIGGALLVIAVYRLDGRSSFGRLLLGTLRAGLIALVIFLLNNPVLTRTSTLIEPSVVAVLVDDSMSMTVRDVTPPAGPAASAAPGPSSPSSLGPSRLAAAVDLLTGNDQALIRKLATVHSLHFYAFDRTARQIGAVRS